MSAAESTFSSDRRLRWLRSRDSILNWGLTLPALALMLAVYFTPLLRVLSISVMEPKSGSATTRCSSAIGAVQRVLMTTFRVSFTTPHQRRDRVRRRLLLTHAEPAAQRLMLLCVLLPFWMSVLVRAFAWVTLLRRQGLVNKALMGLGVIDEPLALMCNELGVIIGMVHYMVPVAMLTLCAKMCGLDRRLIAAARGLGARRGRRSCASSCRSACPASPRRPLVFVFSLGFYVTPAILGGGKTMMAAQYITMQIHDTVRWGMAR